MLVHEEGNLQLGADAVGTRNQHRTADALQIQFEEAAKSADTRQHAGDGGAGHMALHQLHRTVARGDIDACVLIALAMAQIFVHMPFLSP